MSVRDSLIVDTH